MPFNDHFDACGQFLAGPTVLGGWFRWNCKKCCKPIYGGRPGDNWHYWDVETRDYICVASQTKRKVAIQGPPPIKISATKLLLAHLKYMIRRRNESSE